MDRQCAINGMNTFIPCFNVFTNGWAGGENEPMIAVGPSARSPYKSTVCHAVVDYTNTIDHIYISSGVLTICVDSFFVSCSLCLICIVKQEWQQKKEAIA